MVMYRFNPVALYAREARMRDANPQTARKEFAVRREPDLGADVHRNRIVDDGCCVAGALDSGARAMEVDQMIALRRD
jgi:hypothetical protein